jgi:hypothetical protein
MSCFNPIQRQPQQILVSHPSDRGLRGSQSWQIQQIEAAVALADYLQAEWIPAPEIDGWLTFWGTDQKRWSPTDPRSLAPCGELISYNVHQE